MRTKYRKQSAARPVRKPARSFITALLVGLCAAGTLTTRADNKKEQPALPVACDQIAPPEDSKPVLHVFAVGVQIYRWDGSAWVFVAPSALLYADAGHHAQVGTHFGTPSGPAWETTSGSRVIEQRVDSCTPDTSAIPWLLLRTISEDGSGVLNSVSFVQRLNTAGGIAPATAGSFAGEEKQVPYTAEYVFYRSTAKVYRQNNLVSDLPDVAQLQDANLVNPWGLTFSGSGPFWVGNSGSGKATLYTVTNDLNGVEIVTNLTLEVTIPGGRPTGVVSNNKGGFNGDVFLFAGFDGTISGWRSALGTTAETLANRPGAIYTGLALVTNSTGTVLLAANFAEGTLDAYNATGTLIAQFVEPSPPVGYAPFNVQVIDGVVFVMFSPHEPVRGGGLIDLFDPETGKFHRFATGKNAGGKLQDINMPWAVALAPNSFGKHGGDLLFGNFGSGTIMAFGTDGEFHGLLKDVDGQPIKIDKLWALTFGNGGKAGSPDALFFTAGPVAETHGLLGSLKPAGKSDSDND